MFFFFFFTGKQGAPVLSKVNVCCYSTWVTLPAPPPLLQWKTVCIFGHIHVHMLQRWHVSISFTQEHKHASSNILNATDILTITQNNSLLNTRTNWTCTLVLCSIVYCVCCRIAFCVVWRRVRCHWYWESVMCELWGTCYCRYILLVIVVYSNKIRNAGLLVEI